MPACDPTSLSDEELAEHTDAVNLERANRIQKESIPAQIDALNKGYLDATGVVEGAEWVQPEGAHDAYPKDWVVTHNGKTWQSTVMSNVWEPGASGWHEKTEEGGAYPDWVQPTGAHDVYNAGDRVHYLPDDQCYESVIDNNSWSPVDYPAGWSMIGCV